MSFGNVLQHNLQQKAALPVFEFHAEVGNFIQNCFDPAINGLLHNRSYSDGYANPNATKHHLQVVVDQLRTNCFEDPTKLMIYELNEYRLALMTSFFDKLYTITRKEAIRNIRNFADRSTRSSASSLYFNCVKFNQNIYQMYGTRSDIWSDSHNSGTGRLLGYIMLWEMMHDAFEFFKESISTGTEFTDKFFTDPTIAFAERMHKAACDVGRHDQFVGRNGVTYSLKYINHAVGCSTDIQFFVEQRSEGKLSEQEQEALEQSLQEVVKEYADVKIRDRQIFVCFHKPIIPNSAVYSGARNGLRLIFPDELVEALSHTRYIIKGFGIPLSELKTSRTLPGSVHAYSSMDLKTMRMTQSMHPHASSGDGNVCFGNMNSGDTKDVSFTIADLIRMLTTINFDSVYRSIDISNKPAKVGTTVIKHLSNERSQFEHVGTVGKWEEPAVSLNSFFNL